MATKRTDLRGLGSPPRATAKGKPGPDIEEERKRQAKLKWDIATVNKALARTYESRAHAKMGIAKGEG